MISHGNEWRAVATKEKIRYQNHAECARRQNRFFV